ncbi:MAG: sigma-54-dependent Fis family transcriptional regulator [Kiritimatiellae bacterium]|nr:sigma-54-dependent Fis family transcriptional regulator [Kiritimatiellia bacterium]
MSRLLLIDDDPVTVRFVRSSLESVGHDVVVVTSGDLGLKIMTSMHFDIIVVDYGMKDVDGLKFLDTATMLCRGVPVILVSGEDSAQAAREAMARGAFDYVVMPYSMDDLRLTIDAALEYVTTMRNVIEALNPYASSIVYEHVVAASPAMQEVCRRVREVAGTDVPVVLEGEPGTGKDLLARIIHTSGRRKKAYFLALSCAGLRGGTSLDALFRQAGTGTIFFKTLEAVPLSLQSKLAECLKTVSFTDPDRGQMVPLDCRVLGSVFGSFDWLAEQGIVDSELARVFRGNVIAIPPLRGRVEDIRTHVGRILIENRAGRQHTISIDPNALVVLEKYSWPGNVTQLEKTVRDAIILGGGERIRTDDLPYEIVTEVRQGRPGFGRETRDVQTLRGRIVRKYLAGRAG